MDRDAELPLTLGVVTGGPGEARAWIGPLEQASRALDLVQSGIGPTLELNVVFHLAGQYLGNEFAGVRTGLFSRERGRLMVQVAVDGPVGERPMQSIESWLRESIEEARALCEREGYSVGDLSELQDIVTRASRLWEPV